jgi:hypothetical protein
LTVENPATVSKDTEKQLPVRVFEEMERRDEGQILQEMRGEQLEEMVYSIEVQGGKKVTNLSYAGVKEYLRFRGHFKIVEVRVEQDEKEYRCLIILKDLDRDIEVTGASACEKSKPFAWTLAVNKAERNAYRKLIPEKTIANLIQEWLERKKPKPVGASSAVGTPIVQPATEEVKPAAESPIPPAQSPEPMKHTWHVPLTTNQLLPFHIEKGIRQIFLAKGLQSFGVINQDTVNNELAIVPEKTLDPEAGPIHWLIEGTPYRKGVVKPICEKYGLQYELVLEGELLKVIVIFGGSLDQEHVKEIAGGATWAFQRAFEEAK